MYNNPHGGDTETIAAQLGVSTDVSLRLDFSVNVNPLGSPGCVQDILLRGRRLVECYPQSMADSAAGALAEVHGVPASCVVVGNGSTELFALLVQAVHAKRAAGIAPCYAGYAEVCSANGCRFRYVGSATPESRFEMLLDDCELAGTDVFFIGAPNNPTGAAQDPARIIHLARQNVDSLIVVDEAFIDFMPDADTRTLIGKPLPSNLVVVKSLTKFFAIPGLRLGMACGDAAVIERLNNVRLPWSVNALAQEVARELYRDKAYVESTRAAVSELRKNLADSLSELAGVTVYPSEANYVLVRLPEDWPVARLQAELLNQGILVRSCANFQGLGDAYCRLAVRPEHEQKELVDAMRMLFGPFDGGLVGERASIDSRQSKSIMVVGTTSHAGKSVVAAGLCRYFAQMGISVAPFKAQNMSLNSFVTKDGGEMGRAQVAQARAAGVEPETDMNPVLLKPVSDSGSQVIVNGRPIGNMVAQEYYTRKQEMRRQACAAYDRLSRRFDLIILEGAGSPAEINLASEDFVNMAMADYAGADVLLVADIDRGGVFASILGTLELMPAQYRGLVKGVIINKFRGDVSLLKSGIDAIEDMTGVPVLGVLPYLRDLRMEDEDSLSIDDRSESGEARIVIDVVRLPHISNYTDFLWFERTSGVQVRYVSSPSDIDDARDGLVGSPDAAGPDGRAGSPGRPRKDCCDLLILPGSKNTRGDLQFLHESGWSDRIRQLVEGGTPVFGICGGYQMLGQDVLDNAGIEGTAGSDRGLGLLPIRTELLPEKELAQVRGATGAALPFAEEGTPFAGYEIHAGRSDIVSKVEPAIVVEERRGAACSEAAGAVFRIDMKVTFDDVADTLAHAATVITWWGLVSFWRRLITFGWGLVSSWRRLSFVITVCHRVDRGDIIIVEDC